MSQATKKAFRRLLGREEIISVASGHTHKQKVEELNERDRLARKTSLPEYTFPSLVDASRGKGKRDGRAIGVEETSLEKGLDGVVLRTKMRCRELTNEDLGDGLTNEVRERLIGIDGGYDQMIWETRKNLGRYFWRLLRRRLRKAEEKTTLKNAFDSLTTASVMQMFQETEHQILPFLKSLVHFIGRDETKGIGDTAATSQIQGILTTLEVQFKARREEFKTALEAVESVAELRGFNDLYVTSGVEKLPELLSQLKEGGEAAAFALLAGKSQAQREAILHARDASEPPQEILISSMINVAAPHPA